MEPLNRMKQRLDLARAESDTALFFDLTYMGELVTKLVVSALVASLEEDRDRHRYQLEYSLVRGNSIGEWVGALGDLLTGPASQFLKPEAREGQKQLTQRPTAGVETWQSRAVQLMRQTCRVVNPEHDEAPPRPQGRMWFGDFAWLRNRTRGHGAPTPGKCAQMCEPLRESIDLIVSNFDLFQKPWAFLRRNLSGKHRVIPVSGDAAVFDYLKREPDHNLPEGVYIFLGQPQSVALVHTDLDLTDFFVPNGNATHSEYELLSYLSDTRRVAPIGPYTAPPTPLPESETHGLGTLEVQGHSFGNLPQPLGDYVRRPALETELTGAILDDRHPVVSIVGRGGIGKTSLALAVLHSIAAKDRFLAILWFSARDIDLKPYGPKLVRPQVLTDRDISEEFVDLMDPQERDEGGFDARAFLGRSLTRYESGPLLFVFDNFETVRAPADLYHWLDMQVRLPNKVLVTTRLREFKADYPVEVGGMMESEFDELVDVTAGRLGISGLLTSRYRQDLYEKTEGHPYVAKVVLGEVAHDGRLNNVERMMAGRDDILEALFERSFTQLPPVAQRVFLTLCNWRSMVPRLALEAALLRPGNDRMDVEDGLNALRRSSLVESAVSKEDDQEFLFVPLAAALFGKRKLAVSPMKSAVDADTELVRLVGASQQADLTHGVGPRIRRLFGNVARSVEAGGDLELYLPVLEYIARGYSPAWLLLADLYVEEGSRSGGAAEALRRYLEREPHDWEAWQRLASLLGQVRDYAAEANALVQAGTQDGVPYFVASNAALRINTLLGEQLLEVDMEERRALVQTLLDSLEARIQEADATDCSRIAWLYINLREPKKAAEFTQLGLERDPTNQYCLKLKEHESYSRRGRP